MEATQKNWAAKLEKISDSQKDTLPLCTNAEYSNESESNMLYCSSLRTLIFKANFSVKKIWKNDKSLTYFVAQSSFC